jgi:tetratricopeptide (TPR) repeat protein
MDLERLGQYRLLKRLGRGGMATVWLAKDELQDRIVALKLLKEELAESLTARRRFKQEAKTSALLDHPAIAAVYDSGEIDEHLYIAMAYVDGSTVSDLVISRLLPLTEVARIAEQVAGALAYGHALGVMHRDVTGRNIMVAQDGRVLVLDFGIALVQGATRLTSTGTVLGTLAYVAPETLKGHNVDSRSDLYSLGVVMYEALTGRLPFDGQRSEVVTFDVLNRPLRPPSQLRPEIDPDLERIVLRAMCPDPRGRYQDANEFIADLREYRSGRPRTAQMESAKGAHRNADASGSVSVADRLAQGEGPVYLGVLPFEMNESEDDPDGGKEKLLTALVAATSAAAAEPNRVHVVTLAEDAGDDASGDLRGFARSAGVNMVLRGTVRFSGTGVRVLYTLLDTEGGVQIGGDTVDGSLATPFELEDRLAESVRAALGLQDSMLPAERADRPPDPAAEDRLLQARSYMQRSDNEASINGAISLLEGLFEGSGESAATRASLARAYVYKFMLTRQRVWEGKAASACAQAVRLDAKSPDVLLALGDLDAAAERWPEALARFDQLLKMMPQSYDGLLGRARALDAAGKSEEAEAVCRQALTLEPDNWRGYHVLGLIDFRHGGYTNAAELWRRVIELTPDNAGAHRNLGSAYYRLGSYHDAEAAFRQSISMRPNAMAYYNLGTVLFQLEQYEDSVIAFERAVDLNPSDPVAWGNLGNACRFIPARRERAEEALGHAIGLMRERLERHPGDGEGWARLADWLAGLGFQEEAEKAIERALEIAPDEVYCIWSAAKVSLIAGKRREALEYLARAVQRGYGVEALRRDPELRPLQNDPEFMKILHQESDGSDTADASGES